ncbi:ATP-binding protein [Streptomyces armeniacus]|uniref:ATP-binding protein n=1 Tax=Streptomyces armeniacus TaxID=83291 RepID=A0A345XN60_9ACTN|nr:ATP-binding protein [Streptomyces armeniacus]AXK33076.1 ATP-binding protein [Streptomyces armeniacus]
MTELYAREPLVRGLVPKLVGLAHDRQQTVPRQPDDDLPVVLLTGRHGMGKTAVLDELATSYEGRLPLARADLAAAAPTARTQLGTSNVSAVVDTLFLLAEGLAPAVPQYGRRRFDRLLPGLFAVSSWHRGNVAEQTLARERIARLLTACELRSGDEDEGDTGVAWMADVAAQLAEANGDDDLEPVADAVVRQYFDRHVGRREARTVLDWYAAQSSAGDQGPEVLVKLSLRFHRGGDFRYDVEDTLVSAFLADLADAYGTWKRRTGTPRPLALLDNVHTPGGRQLIDLLLRARAGARARGDRPDPLVVVATQLGRGGGAAGEPAEPAAIADAAAWCRLPAGTSPVPLHTVTLPPLSRRDVLAMLDHTPRALDAYLPSALHRLTGGQPLGCGVLSDAVLNLAEERAARPGQLLELTTPDGRPVTEELLERLVGQPQLRDLLVLLSLARDPEAAGALATAYAPLSAEPYPADTAERDLERELWTAGDGTAFVDDPFLRALLVEELRRRCAGDGARYRWQDLHGTLRDHHTALGAEGEPDALRHTLAAGAAEAVVDRLTGCFGDWEAARWLDCLRHVATAPHPPTAEWEDRRQEIARGDHDRLRADTDDVQRSVHRLLHGLWYVVDTVAEPSEQACADMGRELAFLAQRHVSGHAALTWASQEWPLAAREKRPLPAAAGPGGTGGTGGTGRAQ